MRDSRRQPFRWKGDWLVLSAGIVLWAATLLPLLAVASHDARLVETFNTDEAMQVNLLTRALRSHSWALDFGAYGHLSFNLSLAMLKPFWTVSERTVVIAGRALSLASAAGLLLVAFAWARRLTGSLAAWITLALVALNPTVYTWAAIVHPDMLQALLLTLALWLTCSAFEHPTTARLVAASAVAGLAFAAKYSGIFVLPLIAAALFGRRYVTTGTGANTRIRIVRGGILVAGAILMTVAFAIDGASFVRLVTADGHVDVPLPVSPDTLVWILRTVGVAMVTTAVTPWTWRHIQRWRQAETVLWGGVVSFATFAAVFVLVSPYSLYKLAFIKGLYYEAVETGAAMNRHWIDAWTSGILGTLGAPVLVALGANVVGRFVDRRGFVWSAVDLLAETVLWAWIGLYVIVLFAPFHELEPHYALPLVVPGAMLAAIGVIRTTDLLARRFALVSVSLATTAAAAVLSLLAISGVVRTTHARASTLQREHAAEVQAGEWLAAHVPPQARITYDYLSYVPPVFKEVKGTWGESREWLAAENPDIVVINAGSSPLWRGSQGEMPYSGCLRAGTCGYRRVFAAYPIEIFERAGRQAVRITN